MESYKLRGGLLKSEFEHQTNLNSFFTGEDLSFYSGINLSLYEKLKSAHRSGVLSRGFWEPLNYFNVLYDQIDILLSYCHEPFTVIEHLYSLELDEMQSIFLFASLGEFSMFEDFSSETINSEVHAATEKALGICKQLIDKEYNFLADLFQASSSDKIRYEFSFENTLRLLDAYPTLEDKITFLYESIDECKQDLAESPEKFADDGQNYIERCYLKIEHFKRLLAERDNTSRPDRPKGPSNTQTNEPIEVAPDVQLKDSKLQSKVPTVAMIALYYRYLEETKYIPSFDNMEGGKVANIKKEAAIWKVSPNTLQQKFNRTLFPKNRINSNNAVKDIKGVISLLDKYPKAKELAEAELSLAALQR